MDTLKNEYFDKVEEVEFDEGLAIHNEEVNGHLFDPKNYEDEIGDEHE